MKTVQAYPIILLYHILPYLIPYLIFIIFEMVSLQIGHDTGFASSPGGTMT